MDGTGRREAWKRSADLLVDRTNTILYKFQHAICKRSENGKLSYEHDRYEYKAYSSTDEVVVDRKHELARFTFGPAGYFQLGGDVALSLYPGQLPVRGGVLAWGIWAEER